MKKNIRLKHYINYLILGLALVLFIALDLLGVLKRSDANLLAQVGYSVILAVSLNLVVGFLGELSLGHAGFMCVGAYVGGLVYIMLEPQLNKLGAILVALPIGGIAAALFGLLIGLPALRLKGDYLAIVTLAFGEIVRTVIRNQDIFGGTRGLESVRFGNRLYILAFLLAILTVFISQNLRRSKHGRAIQAIRDNEIAARAMGVNVTYYKLVVFAVAAFFAGVAGVLYAGSTSVIRSDNFSFNYSINILVMVVLGGMGSITGSIISAAALTYITVKLTISLSGDMAAIEPMVYALILILAVMWNNAPFLRPVREKLGAKLEALRQRILHCGEVPEDNSPEIAAWDKVPTKIPMDAILSTDFTVDHSFDADRRGKEEEQ
ncbi:MAG: branched-chain amino acid ABC transporter permease [Clostridia bacterium]|nr:branched-chain amino acid ABC transporter permease [Clostridia bacterium]